jgi:hypothetical protein
MRVTALMRRSSEASLPDDSEAVVLTSLMGLLSTWAVREL